MNLFTIGMFISFWLSMPNEQVIFERSFSSSEVNHFIVSNLSGDVVVKAGGTDQIQVIAQLRDEELNEELSIEFKQSKDYLVIYLKTPCTKDANDIVFDPDNPSNTVSWRNNCSYNCNFEGDLSNISFEVIIPKNINVYASTIMKGDIRVSQMDADVWVQNVNGAIDLNDVVNVSHATTVNGDIALNYSDVPGSQGEFSTINGDIKVRTKAHINATATFKSFSGDFYTDMEEISMLPSEVIEQNKENGFKYRIDESRRIKIGDGGVLLAFQTFNGDAYLTTK